MGVRKHDRIAHSMRVAACLLLTAAAALARRGRVDGWGARPDWGGWRDAPPEQWAAVAVLALAATAPFFAKSRGWRTLQLALDVAVLGAWSGQFLSMARLTGWAGSGLPRGPGELAAAALMLSMAFLYPVFGRKGHYCLHACPFGAAQELAARLPAKKWRVGARLAGRLAWVRRGLWAALMLATWVAAWGRWMEWELFGAFAWRAVPPVLAVMALAAVGVSAFVPRAYCRFVCPTGTLFKLSEADGPEEEKKK